MPGPVADELRLDVVLAAESRDETELQKRIQKYLETRITPDDPLSAWRDALHGGNASRGEVLFQARTELSCARCHRIGEIGGQVGPDLSSIAADRNREQLLESIVDPNRVITEGYAQTVILTEDGLMHTGLITSSTDDSLSLLDADGNTTVIDIDTIEEQKTGKSSMPDDLATKLTMSELRDLIEYLMHQGSAAGHRP